MGLSRLPAELQMLVVDKAAQQRGIRRATELRLVSRFFDEQALAAVHRNDLLLYGKPPETARWQSRNVQSLAICKPPWASRYLMHLISHRQRYENSLVRRIADTSAWLEGQLRGRPAPPRGYTQHLSDLVELSIGTRCVLHHLLSNEAAIDKGYDYNIDLLVAAASLGPSNIVNQLLASGTSIYRPSMFFGRPLSAAAASGNVELVTMLLERGVERSSGDSAWLEAIAGSTPSQERSDQAAYYRTALTAASCYGHGSVVEVLLDRRWAMQGMHYPIKAAAHEGHKAVLKTLFRGRPHPHGSLDDLMTTWKGDALRAAATTGQTDLISALLRDLRQDASSFSNFFKPWSDQQRHQRCSKDALAIAASHGHLQTVATLLDLGDILEARSSDHYADPLCHAARRGYPRAAQLLLDAGANIDGACPSRSPLSGAVETGQLEMFLWLLEHGAQWCGVWSEEKPRPGEMLCHALARSLDGIAAELKARGARVEGCRLVGLNVRGLKCSGGHDPTPNLT